MIFYSEDFQEKLFYFFVGEGKLSSLFISNKNSPESSECADSMSLISD